MISPWSEAASIFTLPSLPHTPNTGISSDDYRVWFSTRTNKEEGFVFLSAFAEWNLLVLLTGHALGSVGLVRTLSSEHIGLLALLNPFPYPG